MSNQSLFKRAGIISVLATAAMAVPTTAQASMFDTVKSWFSGASSSSTDYRTPGFVPSGNGQAGVSAGDANAKALCDDLGNQLAQAQANAYNQRAAVKDLSKSLAEFGIKSILGGSPSGSAVLGNVRNVATEIGKQYIQQETNKQLNPQAQSPAMNTLR